MNYKKLNNCKMIEYSEDFIEFVECNDDFVYCRESKAFWVVNRQDSGVIQVVCELGDVNIEILYAEYITYMRILKIDKLIDNIRSKD